MEYDSTLVSIVRWITHRFPFFPDYAKIITPVLIFGASVSSVLFKILPIPGYRYPVPETEDIRRELKNDTFFLYCLVRFSRWLTVHINKIISTKSYSVFYKFTGFWSILISKFRGDKDVIREVKITIPDPVYVKLKFKKEDNDNDSNT